jgi:hypothetical protein
MNVRFNGGQGASFRAATKKELSVKKTKLIAAVALAFACTGAQAALFDPDGGGALGTINVGAFDWSPTSIFADEANTAIANFVATQGSCLTASCTFNLYTHARVIGFTDPNGVPIVVPGLNTTFELTMIARFTEVVTGVGDLNGGLPGGQVATFATVSSSPGFLEIFFDSSPDSVDVSGSGFNDGRLILSGTQIGDATSLFTITSETGVPLDGSPNGNDYDGQLTVSGTGSSDNLPVDNLSQDFAFFLQQLEAFGITFANISLGLPYISVDPSDCFTGAASGVGVGNNSAGAGCDPAHIDGLMSAQVPAPAAPGILPVIGLVNATSPSALGGPDFVAQTDFNSPLRAVPEPGGLALFGLGLGALWLGTFRRRLLNKSRMPLYA